jgi:crotonobetainyl-CoA:carnitine CoA-transferase CaiB-like acyl-CoA transferase
MPLIKCKWLEKIRIVDLSRVLSGPFCTRMLADLGAEIIKVESGSGDPTRQYPPARGTYGYYFTQFNVGKKSLGLNLRHPKGVEIIKGLISVSDVVLENFRPGVLDKMGLGYSVLRQVNPRIILCSISGFGQTGPERDRLAYTDNIQAYSGMDYIAAKMVGPDADPPGYPYSFGDTYASLNAAIAILGALLHREFTGEGEAIDISMLDCVLAANDSTLEKHIFSEGQLDTAGIAFRPPLRVKDGHMAAALAMQFERVTEAIGRPDLLEDERFKTMEERHKGENFDEYLQIVKEWAKDKTIEEVSQIFEKYDIPYGKVNTIEEVVNSPVVNYRDMLVHMELPNNGPVRVVNTPFKVGRNACGPQGPPPRLGEHNQEILKGLLKLSKEEITALAREGILVEQKGS